MTALLMLTIVVLSMFIDNTSVFAFHNTRIYRNSVLISSSSSSLHSRYTYTKTVTDSHTDSNTGSNTDIITNAKTIITRSITHGIHKVKNLLTAKTAVTATPASSIVSKLLIIVTSLFMIPKKVYSMGGGLTGPIDKSGSSLSPFNGAIIWLVLFTLSATLHSAESAITKISPWKVQEFAEEEGKDSPFAKLSENLTMLLSTILLLTTACSIYSTALFVTTASDIFPNASLGSITAALTTITLFFGELLPKALAVSNSELVARKLVPIISRVAAFLLPITTIVTFFSNLFLNLIGMRSEEDRNVSEDMLRMVVDEAQRTEGIDTGEGRMIKAVLDMQDKEVNKIMKPRVDIVAVPESAHATDILKIAVSTKYTRIPVYRGDVDNIVGVLFVKDLLDYMTLPPEATNTEGTANNKQISTADISKFRPQMMDSWMNLKASELMEATYFIPETMTTWNALQEMRRRRLHLAIVVDEYGGTSGLVTFEDILEEVVGEIYDEDDEDEQKNDSKTIFKGPDGKFEMKGYAELDDVSEALGMKIGEEMLNEYSTIGGLLCSLAGEIPKEGDRVILDGYRFTVREVEDNRRIVMLSAEFIDINKDNNDSNSSSGDNDFGDSARGNVDSDDSSSSSSNGVDNSAVFYDGVWVESKS